MERDRNLTLTSLMQDYYSNIWAFVYARVRNYHVADDLTQEVFVRVWMHLDDFRNESSYKTWLYTIARNTCTDYARSAFIRRVFPKQKQWFETMAAHHAKTGRDDVVESILSSELWSELFQLRTVQREVVLLHLKEDLTFREIAEIVGAKEVTVRARYRRAIETLRNTGHEGGDKDVL